MRRLKDSEVTPELRTFAIEALKELVPKGVGAAKELVSQGRRYVAKLEPHTYYGADPSKPHTEHAGITLYYADEPLILPARLPAAPLPRGAGDVPGVPFRQARNYTRGPRSSVQLVVIHTAECNETIGAAENLAAWAAGPNAPKASWHYAVDADSVTQSVREQDIAWHAPGANGASIGIEHAGRAAQDAAGWRDDYSSAVLERSARLVAAICARWNIPIRQLTPAQLLAGMTGICGHVDVSLAFKRSTHWDPGPTFPWDGYLEHVRSLTPITRIRQERPTLRQGASGPAVADWQRFLQIKADGAFGPRTDAAVRAWQTTQGLVADGVLGPKSWGAFDRLQQATTNKTRLPEDDS